VNPLRDSFPLGLDAVPSTHPLYGTFVDDALEKTYREESFDASVRRYIRFSVTISVIAFLLYGVHDAIVIPEAYRAAWLFRFGVFAPIGLFLTWFALKNRRWQWHQPAMLVLGMGVNGVVLSIAAIAGTSTGFFIYTGFAVAFLTLGPLLARMNVKAQAAYTLYTIGLYDLLEAFVAHSSTTVRVSLNLTFATLGIIGVLAARQLELIGRLAFLQRRIIRDQMEALDVERQRSETLLLNILPRRIAERLKSAPAVTIAERFDQATVLFSDIVGFTELSARLPADEVVRRLDEVFTRFDRIAEELGLEKIKTIGDAYMVAGGVPERRADHAEAVCLMALRMREDLAALSAQNALQVRIGVHSGPVIAGVIGRKKFIYDIWGDTVNTASRMESHGLPGEIQVSNATYEATRDVFDYTSRGEIQVKGKGTMTTWLLKGRREPETGRTAIA
jgi:adenylate cyclase